MEAHARGAVRAFESGRRLSDARVWGLKSESGEELLNTERNGVSESEGNIPTSEAGTIL